MENKTRAHLIVHGRVQGVFFRAETQRAAKRFGVSGWVRNKRDGTVEAIVEGPEIDVISLANWCRTGPPQATVEKVDVSWLAYQGEFERFDIRY
ncbi:acylphosphatase [Desulfosarcina ovata]|uniref:Acylphosphatase n=2 Tax=Desulfosarcina ovata TaxID=83564 RepID=A0A5K8A8F8_9BACT|nr:acylphosphatase [Desulfosarcina ovata]BBO81373.1 acylphosphatase [Desulfosarcina ovata subsp. sediminis]BBO88624.1 acylphosphatase [Desulfosarcina ovata subsp. ovata]